MSVPGRALAVAGVLVAGGRLLRRPVAPDPTGPDVVVADDGTRLYVELQGPVDAPVTVVLVHGFTARLEEWTLQRGPLAEQARVVLYDQRGHGRSGWGNVRHATMDQLARDLSAVLDAHAPTGPVVLVGHSMGGMTLMALARLRPDLFDTRVTGVFLLATSAGDLATGGAVGAIARTGKRLHLLPLWLRLLQLSSPLLDRLYRRGTPTGFRFTRRQLFGRDDADPELVRQVQDLLELAPFTVTAAFYPTFLEHDELASLEALRAVPVSILVGDSDRLTPASHSRRIAAALPDAELTVVPGAGHSVNITRPQVVDAALARLLARARSRAAA